MPDTALDALAEFVTARMDAAATDKRIYDRSGARMDGQLLQGEINMGNAVLAWIEKRRTGAPVAEDEPDDIDDQLEA